MKPFDLEKALAGEAVVTRDGRVVEEIKIFKTMPKYPIVAVIGAKAYLFGKSGVAYSFVPGESNLELFMAPVTCVAWLNLYKDGMVEIVADVTAPVRAGYIETRKIEWEI